MRNDSNDLRWAWWSALALFVLAGSTGALFRFGMLYGLPFGLQFGNVRHAHSHLMYFGWVTPALMALIVTRLPGVTLHSLSRNFRRVIITTLILAFFAYFPFLFSGYDVAVINGHRFPPGVIGASLNVFAWYAFAWFYFAETRGVAHNTTLRFWDWAIVFQILASFGAWGRAVLVALKVDDPFATAAMVDLFLDLFSDGWFILAVLGLALAAFPKADEANLRRGQRLVIIGLPVTFLLAVEVDLVPVALRLIAGVGGMVVAIGLGLIIRSLWRAIDESNGWAWKIPLVFLALKAIAELGLSVPSIAAWGENAGLRIPYLHVLFLGFVTLALFAAAEATWGVTVTRGRAWLTVAIIALIAALIPLTNLWLPAWGGRWTLVAAAITATLPPLTVIGMLVQARMHKETIFGGNLARSTH